MTSSFAYAWDALVSVGHDGMDNAMDFLEHHLGSPYSLHPVDAGDDAWLEDGYPYVVPQHCWYYLDVFEALNYHEPLTRDVEVFVNLNRVVLPCCD